MSTPRDFHSAKRFRDKMVEYIDEYTEYLLLVKSDGTMVSHREIIHEFIEYLFGQHLISNLDQITVSIANSKFLAKYKQKYPEEVISNITIKGILKGYFTFIYGKYGIKNERIMRGFDYKTK